MAPKLCHICRSSGHLARHCRADSPTPSDMGDTSYEELPRLTPRTHSSATRALTPYHKPVDVSSAFKQVPISPVIFDRVATTSPSTRFNSMTAKKIVSHEIQAAYNTSTTAHSYRHHFGQAFEPIYRVTYSNGFDYNVSSSTLDCRQGHALLHEYFDGLANTELEALRKPGVTMQLPAYTLILLHVKSLKSSMHASDTHTGHVLNWTSVLDLLDTNYFDNTDFKLYLPIGQPLPAIVIPRPVAIVQTSPSLNSTAPTFVPRNSESSPTTGGNVTIDHFLSTVAEEIRAEAAKDPRTRRSTAAPLTKKFC